MEIGDYEISSKFNIECPCGCGRESYLDVVFNPPIPEWILEAGEEERIQSVWEDIQSREGIEGAIEWLHRILDRQS